MVPQLYLTTPRARAGRIAAAAVALVIGVVYAVDGQAQTAPQTAPQTPPAADWTVKLGAGAALMPDYEGSDEYELKPIPDIEVDYRGIVALRGPALSLDLFKATGFVGTYHGWRGGPRVRYAFGRDQDDNDALRGLGDVDGSVEAGGFLGYATGPWSAELSVLQDVGDGHEGLTAELGAGYRFSVNQRLGGRIGASLTYADDSYMQSFFGVTAAQSARSGYAVETAEGGLKDAGIGVGLNYALTDHWMLGGFVGYKRLLGDAADAQIVEDEGSANQFRVGVTLGYKF